MAKGKYRFALLKHKKVGENRMAFSNLVQRIFEFYI
jgi:hypothetical protein